MSERWDILTNIAKAISTSPYWYNGNAEFEVEPGKWLNRDAYWETLNEDTQQKFLNYANAAYQEIGHIGFQTVMVSAYDDYLSEK